MIGIGLMILVVAGPRLARRFFDPKPDREPVPVPAVREPAARELEWVEEKRLGEELKKQRERRKLDDAESELPEATRFDFDAIAPELDEQQPEVAEERVNQASRP